jgi:hypothetical protein
MISIGSSSRGLSEVNTTLSLNRQAMDAINGRFVLSRFPPRKDAAAHKATYVSVHGLAGAQNLASRLLEEAEQALVPLGSRSDELLGIARLIVERRS